MAWTTISIVVRGVVSLSQLAILTRYLEKTDFGLVAVATVFIGFTQIFLDLGISVGIMHKQDTTSEEYSSLFWLNLITGVALSSILILLSPIVSSIYNEPSLSTILMFLSLTVFFSSVGSQHRTIQQKEMRFFQISIVEIITSILTFGIAVFTAMNGFGVYSLVYSTLFNTIILNSLYLCIGLYKDKNISFHFSLRETFPFLKIGAFKIGSSILDYFAEEIDTIIISTAFNMEVLGVYNLCKRIVIMLFSVVNQILVKVMIPIFAKLQGNLDLMRNSLYSVMEGITFFNCPLYSTVAILATGILSILYGTQYLDAGILLSFMAVYYCLLSSGSVIGCVQVAMGRTDVGFYWTIARIIINSLAVWIGSLFSIEGIVISLITVNILISPVSWNIIVKPLIGGRFLEYFLITFKPFCFTLLLSIPYYIIFHNSTEMGWMALFVMSFLLVYLGVLWMFYRNSYFWTLLTPRLFPYINNFISN